jgi:hypothetical protein
MKSRTDRGVEGLILLDFELSKEALEGGILCLAEAAEEAMKGFAQAFRLPKK